MAASRRGRVHVKPVTRQIQTLQGDENDRVARIPEAAVVDRALRQPTYKMLRNESKPAVAMRSVTMSKTIPNVEHWSNFFAKYPSKRSPANDAT
mmetsp:Transcript_4074/g.10465  ORF Transcript_4074/g.10465 Transcript_4074/m.10465 type:complete len:94 (+) Transcript_4074:324-605(+)